METIGLAILTVGMYAVGTWGSMNELTSETPNGIYYIVVASFLATLISAFI